MLLPKTKKLNLPFLQFLDDDKPHKMSEVVVHLAKHFKLTKEEIELKKQKQFQNILQAIGFEIKLKPFKSFNIN